MEKKELKDKILSDPKEIKTEQIDRLLFPENEIIVNDLLDLFLRCYDLNNLDRWGNADKDLLGKLNARSNKRRRKKFYRAVRKDSNRKFVYVEGDSWFQHPLIKDLSDYLKRLSKIKTSKQYAVYNSSKGGEWIFKILKDGKYISEISECKPDVMLLSGGGNDLVENRKVSYLVDREGGYLFSDFQDIQIEALSDTIKQHTFLNQIVNLEDDPLSNEELKALKTSFKYLSKDFYSLIWILQITYKFIIKNVRAKYPNLKIVTTGYDYPIPSYKKFSLNIKKSIINIGMKNGHWLADALNRARIPKKDQKAVMFGIIYIFNEMLINTISKSSEVGENTFHVDSRGVSKWNIRNWYDEMHVKPKIFKKIALKLIECIEYPSLEPSVFKVKS